VTLARVPEDRPISPDEAALVAWLLSHGSLEGDLSALQISVNGLRVVARCTCGCPSVDFVSGGQRDPAIPVAEGFGVTASGDVVAATLWQLGEVVSGLEVQGLEVQRCTLPRLDSMSRSFPGAGHSGTRCRRR